jgi:hypothetical protein
LSACRHPPYKDTPEALTPIQLAQSIETLVSLGPSAAIEI